jgi:phytoene dehydrogenase-like protein
MSKTYDAIIIGGGHNGLVAAAYLAIAGRRVLVLERRAIVGGAAVTEELFPGFRFSTCADGAGYLSPQIRRDLNLDAFGLQILPADPVLFSPQPDGSHLTIWRDTDRTVKEIERFSAADAVRYPVFVDLMSKIAGVVGGMMQITPPDLPDMSWGDLRGLLTMTGTVRTLGRKNVNHLLRVLPMPVADLLNEWFESDALKGAIAANGVRHISWGPQEAGTAYMMLYNWAGSDNRLFRSAGVVKGGMGELTQAIAKAAESFGAEIRTEAEVTYVTAQGGRATGTTLASGEAIEARVVVSNADPRTTFLELLGPRYLAASFVGHVQNIKYRGSGARVHLALSELPEFTAINGDDPGTYLRGPIQIAPSMEYIQRAYDPVKYGQFSRRPYLDIIIPTLTDPGLAPKGQHIMSITAKYAPYHLRGTDWQAQRDAFGESVINTLAKYAPNIRDAILHCQVMTPLDLEAVYGLPEGNPNHGEMTLDQFLHIRPIPGWAQYRTPLDGLYLCGAGTHPGGGVTGMPGKNAAREILKDWGKFALDKCR